MLVMQRMIRDTTIVIDQVCRELVVMFDEELCMLGAQQTIRELRT